MFGSRQRTPRPVLLLLVYGIFLVIVGITATSQVVLVSAHFSSSTLESVVSTDAALVRSFANSNLMPADLDPATLSPTRRAVIEDDLGVLVKRAEILRVEIRLPDGRVVVSDVPGLSGAVPASADFLASVQSGEVSAGIDAVERSEAAGPPLGTTDILREYFPLQADGQVQAVIGVWRDAVPILAKLDSVRRDIVIATVSAALLATMVLSIVFRSAQARITRQTAALVEATRRDPLTGSLNHGALVDDLAIAIEEHRREDRALGVALIDIDGFRLLNETYGHAAGDRALLIVASSIADQFPDVVTWGRYGPDEFLLVVPSSSVATLADGLDALRIGLHDAVLQFDASERLPITVSAGMCLFPEHASSVTDLLTTVAITLQEAKSSGGDAIRLAGATAESPEARTFDIFQGLIFAVDTKDRYTKRHSEDVARYSVFLAQLLGLDDHEIGAIRMAGLLHDVGKVGIPDHVLRKPGKLTAEEYGIVQQHVVLGDMIVRDLPDIDVIRAGVRHHHERWDGEGYLHRLAGEEIPLVARILAVGDAFSAMTTTRPYRKALTVEEALRRLEDAAGTQLEERLVAAFVNGIATAADPPLPGADGGRLWTPSRRVA